MKKILKLILASAIALQSFVSLSAYAAEGWEVSYAGSVNTDRTKYYAEVTETYKFSGDTSMLIKYPGTPVDGNYMEVKTGFLSELSAGDYTLVVYYKPSPSSHTEILIGDSITLKFADMVKEKATAPSGESSWSKYTYDFTYTPGGEEYLSFKFKGGTATAAIDEIGLFAKDSIDNLIPDPGFDGVQQQLPEDEPFETDEYQAKDFIAAPGNGKIGLSWVNPVTSDLSDVELYDITSGEWTLLSSDISVKPGAVINYPVTDLTNGAYYRYAVKFEFKTKPAFTYFISGYPAAGNRSGIGKNWKFEDFKNGAAGYCPSVISLSDDTMSGDGYSMRLRTNIDKTIPELSGNIYLRFLHNITGEANTKYKLRFKAKCEGIDGKIQLLWNWNPFAEFAPSWACPELTGTKDWAEYEYTLDSGEKIPEYVQFLSDIVGTLYLDDIELYKLDESGEVTGDNLLMDGDFDGLYSDEVGIMDSVDVIDLGMNNVTFAYSAGSNVAGINIYQKVFDNYEYRGNLDLENTTLNIEQLSIGTEYTYMFVPYNSVGAEGEGYEVTVTTDIPDYEISAPVLYKANSIVGGISGESGYTVQTTVKNYKVENMKYAQCVCVYKDGTLVNMYVTDITPEVQDKNAPAVKVNTTFELDGSEDAVKVFILDSVSTMNKLSTTTIYE